MLVVFDPAKVSYEELLRVFWENHDPTQGMRQGNDVGTQYRSVIHTYGDDQQAAAEASREMYQAELRRSGYEEITTEIVAAPAFYYAEEYHQQYLAKNPARLLRHRRHRRLLPHRPEDGRLGRQPAWLAGARRWPPMVASTMPSETSP